MTMLMSKQVGAYKYEVHVDQDFDAKDEHFADWCKDALNRGEIYAYGVIKYGACKCCSMWSEVSSLWGILDETEDAALDYFLEHCNES